MLRIQRLFPNRDSVDAGSGGGLIAVRSRKAALDRFCNVETECNCIINPVSQRSWPAAKSSRAISARRIYRNCRLHQWIDSLGFALDFVASVA